MGGSGSVGGLLTPLLRRLHDVTVYDRRPPADAVRFIQGEASDRELLAKVVDENHALIYLLRGELEQPASMHEAQVELLELALRCASESRLCRVLYASTTSVYGDDVWGPDEQTEPRPDCTYSLCKWLGESVCEYFARVHGLPVFTLRLNNPVSTEVWLDLFRSGRFQAQTAAPDLADAFHRALTAPWCGYEAFNISGDWTHKLMPCRKARRLLGWSARTRPPVSLLARLLAREIL